MKPDECKIEAIADYPRPQNKQDVLRLLGMVNFKSKFTPQFSDVTAPLRELIKKNVEFHWTERQENAFNNLKDLLSNSETLQYYDVTKPVMLQVDASQKGLGAVLYQDKGPVAYASKVMNETRQHYAQIKKELLLFSAARDSINTSTENTLSSKPITNHLKRYFANHYHKPRQGYKECYCIYKDMILN